MKDISSGRLWLALGCFFCGLTVLIGAFAAHTLKPILTPYNLEVFETATKYMMFHALGLLALGLWNRSQPSAKTLWAGLFFSTGILLFSGSLYLLVLTGEKKFGMITPLGGVWFMLGWGRFFFSVVRGPQNSPYSE